MKKEEIAEILGKLTKDDLLAIIKYGLRHSNLPEEITVEDIFTLIGCMYNESC